MFVAGGIVAGSLAWMGMVFHCFIRRRNRLREAWSGVDVQLKRRHDLVPELVECVRGYRDYERRAMEELTQARCRALSAREAAQASDVEGGLVSQLRAFFAVAEGGSKISR